MSQTPATGPAKKRKVAHLTSVHAWNDARIFVKECQSLATGPYEVHLIAPERGEKPTLAKGVSVSFIPTDRWRPKRIVMSPWRMLTKALRTKADLYHFHDPELMPIGLLLRLVGKKVIYDIHEDVPKQLRHKHWVPVYVRKPIAFCVRILEQFSVRCFSHSFTVCEPIRDRFPKGKVSLLMNYPLLNELAAGESMPYQQRPNEIVYIGGISKERGITELVNAMAMLSEAHARLALAGTIQKPGYEDELKRLPGWSRVDFKGHQDRAGVYQILSRSRVGMVALHDTANHLLSVPVKMFEYLAAGVPIIASDFPQWRARIEKFDCAVFVNPKDPAEIKSAIEWLLANPEKAEQMGARGKKAVKDHFNWDAEARHLLEVYQRLLPS